MEGIVFDIQRNSYNDGPGIRTTIFLKGCSLNCAWCHNEESVEIKPMLRFYPEKCQHCMACVEACKAGAHVQLNGKHSVHFDTCIQNWDCILVCPSGALVRTGEEYSVEALIGIVEKDRSYYENSGGGMTVSGGEPMVQYEFTKQLLSMARQKNIHTCLDTTGNASWKLFEALLDVTDIFLYDYKASDPFQHKMLTGVRNERIINNLHNLNAAGASIILRCPIIPGENDTDAHFEAIAELSNSLEHIKEVHLLPYHSMGICKSVQHGIPGKEQEFRTPGDTEKESWRTILNNFDAKNIHIF